MLAIVTPDSHEEAANVMVGYAGLTCVVALIAGLFIPCCDSWLLGESFYNELKGWLWSVPPLIIFMGFYLAVNAWCTLSYSGKRRKVL
jgi:hypothetical protein